MIYDFVESLEQAQYETIRKTILRQCDEAAFQLRGNTSKSAMYEWLELALRCEEIDEPYYAHLYLNLAIMVEGHIRNRKNGATYCY